MAGAAPPPQAPATTRSTRCPGISTPTVYDSRIRASRLSTLLSPSTSARQNLNTVVSTASCTTLDRTANASRLLAAPSPSRSPQRPTDGQNVWVGVTTVVVARRSTNVGAVPDNSNTCKPMGLVAPL